MERASIRILQLTTSSEHNSILAAHSTSGSVHYAQFDDYCVGQKVIGCSRSSGEIGDGAGVLGCFLAGNGSVGVRTSMTRVCNYIWRAKDLYPEGSGRCIAMGG